MPSPSSSLSLTPVTVPPLPLPDALPDDPYAATPQVVLGHVSIPKLGVEADLQEGVTLTAINRGPGHWPGTPGPGGLGNMVVAGHRTTYSKPFNRLDELVAGDRVIFTTDHGTSTYEVRGTIVVPAANIGIAAQSHAHTATLFACHPKGSAAERIVTKLRLLDDDGRPVDPDQSLPPLDQGSDPTSDTTLVVRAGTGGSGSPSDPLSQSDG
jgi:sortase A